MVIFRQDKVVSLLGIPLKDLLLKGGAEEFVGTIELLKKKSSLKVCSAKCLIQRRGI